MEFSTEAWWLHESRRVAGLGELFLCEDTVPRQASLKTMQML